MVALIRRSVDAGRDGAVYRAPHARDLRIFDAGDVIVLDFARRCA